MIYDVPSISIIAQHPSIWATIPTALPKAPKIGAASPVRLAIPKASPKICVRVQSAAGGLYAMV